MAYDAAWRRIARRLPDTKWAIRLLVVDALVLWGLVGYTWGRSW